MRRNRKLQVLALLIAAVIVVPVAGAAAGGAAGRTAPAARKSPAKPAKGASAAKQLASLRTEAESLARRVATLKATDATLAATPAAPAPVQQSIEPASGPAGGDLVGTFPAPTLAPHSVSSTALQADSIGLAQLAPGTLTNYDFAPESIGPAEIADGSIGATQVFEDAFDASRLAETFRWPPEIRGPNVSITLAPGQHGRATVTCPNGTRLISGGFVWKNLDGKGTEILNSSPASGLDAFYTWEVAAKVQSGGTENTLTPVALCLE